jgi:hypothetical protein
MADRKLFKSYLPSALRKRIQQYAAKKGVSESSVANAAISRYLDDANDAPLILRKLQRIDQNLDRSRRDSDVLSEAFASFVQIWLAHTPRLPDAEKRRAENSALQRFREYAEYVSERVGKGESFISDLLASAGPDADTSGSKGSP